MMSQFLFSKIDNKLQNIIRQMLAEFWPRKWPRFFIFLIRREYRANRGVKLTTYHCTSVFKRGDIGDGGGKIAFWCVSLRGDLARIGNHLYYRLTGFTFIYSSHPFMS